MSKKYWFKFLQVLFTVFSSQILWIFENEGVHYKFCLSKTKIHVFINESQQI